MFWSAATDNSGTGSRRTAFGEMTSVARPSSPTLVLLAPGLTTHLPEVFHHDELLRRGSG